jgi:hypothetical protein
MGNKYKDFNDWYCATIRNYRLFMPQSTQYRFYNDIIISVDRIKVRHKKKPVVPVPDRPYFFLPTLLFFQRDWPCDPIFSRWLRAAHTACQNGVCCHTNYWTKLPKFVHRKYASLVKSILMSGLYCKSPSKKPPKPWKKYLKKKFISDLPTLIFSQYETGTTGIFFYA